MGAQKGHVLPADAVSECKQLKSPTSGGGKDNYEAEHGGAKLEATTSDLPSPRMVFDRRLPARAHPTVYCSLALPCSQST